MFKLQTPLSYRHIVLTYVRTDDDGEQSSSKSCTKIFVDIFARKYSMIYCNSIYVPIWSICPYIHSYIFVYVFTYFFYKKFGCGILRMVGPKNLVDPNGGSIKVHETQKFNEKWSPKPVFFNTFFSIGNDKRTFIVFTKYNDFLWSCWFLANDFSSLGPTNFEIPQLSWH